MATSRAENLITSYLINRNTLSTNSPFYTSYKSYISLADICEPVWYYHADESYPYSEDTYNSYKAPFGANYYNSESNYNLNNYWGYASNYYSSTISIPVTPADSKYHNSSYTLNTVATMGTLPSFGNGFDTSYAYGPLLTQSASKCSLWTATLSTDGASNYHIYKNGETIVIQQWSNAWNTIKTLTASSFRNNHLPTILGFWLWGAGGKGGAGHYPSGGYNAPGGGGGGGGAVVLGAFDIRKFSPYIYLGGPDLGSGVRRGSIISTDLETESSISSTASHIVAWSGVNGDNGYPGRLIVHGGSGGDTDIQNLGLSDYGIVRLDFSDGGPGTAGVLSDTVPTVYKRSYVTYTFTHSSDSSNPLLPTLSGGSWGGSSGNGGGGGAGLWFGPTGSSSGAGSSGLTGAGGAGGDSRNSVGGGGNGGSAGFILFY